MHKKTYKCQFCNDYTEKKFICNNCCVKEKLCKKCHNFLKPDNTCVMCKYIDNNKH